VLGILQDEAALYHRVKADRYIPLELPVGEHAGGCLRMSLL
jgi:hypothetical protein